MTTSYQVTLSPGGQKFSTEGNESLLQAALNAGFSLPYGCRTGACGACKAKVTDGLVDHGNAQDGALSIADRSVRMALLCCAKPLSDLVLECREVSATKDIPIKILPCRVQKMERAADDVIVLSLKLPTNEHLQFLPGQYIEFLLKGGKRRAFSIANASHQNDFIELHIRRVPDGEFTAHVFDVMKEKDILRFQGPYGSFYLRDDSTKPIIFLAGGTGFAPIKSVIEDALHKKTIRSMALYWGARNQPGLYRNELAEQWTQRHPNLSYHPVLSDLSAGELWSGRTGLVHQAVVHDHPDLSAFQVYACGSPAMIDAARDAFFARGLPEHEFFADAFTFSLLT